MSHCFTVAITLRVMDFLKPVKLAEFFPCILDKSTTRSVKATII